MANEFLLEVRARGLNRVQRELDETAESGKKVEKSVDNIGRSINELEDDLKQLTAARNASFNDKDIKRFNREIQATEREIKKLKGTSTSILQTVGRLGASLGLVFGAREVIRGVFSSIQAFNEFEASLSSLSAITGATGADLDFLKEKAFELANGSTQSATTILEAFKLIGSAKPELLENGEALADLTEKAIVLAEATGQDVAQAGQDLGNILNALQLPAEEAGRLINVLAAASQRGAKEVPFVSEALSKFGGVAANAGVGIEESVAAVEQLGKAIPQATIVGTNLRGILLKLQVIAQENGREFAGLAGELDLLADRQKDVTFLTNQFGQENLLAIQTLITQRQELKGLTTAITDTNTAYDQQRIRTDNAQADIQRLNNSLQTLKIQFGETLAVGFRPLVQGLTRLANRLTDTRTATQRSVEALQDQRDQFEQQQRSLQPLIARYEELQSKANLSAIEQDELKTITQQIGEILPEAITEWDKYGDAVAISAGKVNDLTEAQKDLLRFTERETIQELREEYERLNGVIETNTEALETRNLFFRQTQRAARGTQNAIDQLGNSTREAEIAQANILVSLNELGVELNDVEKAFVEATLGFDPFIKKIGGSGGTGGGGNTNTVAGSLKAMQEELALAKKALLDLPVRSAAYDEQILKIKELSDAIKVVALESQLIELGLSREEVNEFGRDLQQLEIAVKSITSAWDLLEKEIQDAGTVLDEFIENATTGADSLFQQIVNTTINTSQVEDETDAFWQNWEEDQKIREMQDQERLNNRIEAARAASDLIGTIFSRRLSKEQQDLERKREADLITEEEYQRGLAKINRRQAAIQKAAALFEIAINSAVAITAAAKSPFTLPATIPLLAALTAAQVAAVLAAPVPAFKEGVIDFQGKGTETSDSNLARISKGESVMTAAETRKHRQALVAIRGGKFDNEYVRIKDFPQMGRSADLGGFDDENIIFSQNSNAGRLGRKLDVNNVLLAELNKTFKAKRRYGI